MFRIIFFVSALCVVCPIAKCKVDIQGKTKILGRFKLVSDEPEQVSNEPEQVSDEAEHEHDVAEADEKDEDKKEIIFEDIKSGGGSSTPAFVHRHQALYEKYRNGTIIEKEEFFKDLLQTTRKLNDFIIFQEQCLSDQEYDFLKNLSDHLKHNKVIVIKVPDVVNAVHLIQNVTLGEEFHEKNELKYKNVKVPYPYYTLKRNELQLNSNYSRTFMQNEIHGFVDKYTTNYEAFEPLLYHYTWIRFHMHGWPSNLTMDLRKRHQRKHFGIIFENFVRRYRNRWKQFIIYTSDMTYCHAGQMKKPKEIWKMEDKRYGATTIWCRTHHILLQIADLTVLYPNEYLAKPKGPRYCETTVYRKHMVVGLRIEQYSTDVDLFFDIKLPSRGDAYRTYTVERCYLQGRKSEGWEFNRVMKLGTTFYNKHNRIVLKKACPRNGALILGTIGLEYLHKNDDNEIKETFSNEEARRIVFLVEGGLQNYCRVRKVFDWMAFAKKICVMMILIALPSAFIFMLALLLIRLRFYIYKIVMCIVNQVMIMLRPKNLAKAGRAAKRLVTPVAHLVGIGAYLLQRFVYNICVKFGGAQSGRGGSFSARLCRAREYTAQHIGNVAIYFIQGLVTISVVRAITLVAATLLEIS